MNHLYSSYKMRINNNTHPMYINYFRKRSLTDEEIDYAFNIGLVGKLVMYKSVNDSELNRLRALKKEIGKIIVNKVHDRNDRLNNVIVRKNTFNVVLDEIVKK